MLRSRAIPAATGGVLVAASLVGFGSLFRVGLPSARAEAPAATATEPVENIASIPAPFDSVMAEKVRDLDRAVQKQGGKLALSVVDLRTGTSIAAKDADLALNPASNAKLLTAWAALKALGPQHRYLTGLYGKIRVDQVDTLVLRGDGDPSLEFAHLYAMVAELRLAGVRMVGDIVVDQSAFDAQQDPPAYDQQPEEWAGFRAPISAIAVDGNTVHVTVYPTTMGEPARVRAVPASVVELRGTVTTAGPATVESVTVAMTPKKEGRLRAIAEGSIPAGAAPVTLWRRVADPTWHAGYALYDACRELGLKVHGKVRRGHPAVADLLASHRSEPLGKLLHALGKQSDNFHAEMIFKSLGGTKGSAASFEAARTRVFDLLAQARIEAKDLRFDNGSGLFDADRMSPRFITTLLAAAAKDPTVGPEFLAQLAIGGVDGTLRSRFETLASGRTVRGKTGTLHAVSALSGYVLGADGKPALAFSFLANDVPNAATALRKELDDAVLVTASAAGLAGH